MPCPHQSPSLAMNLSESPSSPVCPSTRKRQGRVPPWGSLPTMWGSASKARQHKQVSTDLGYLRSWAAFDKDPGEVGNWAACSRLRVGVAHICVAFGQISGCVRPNVVPRDQICQFSAKQVLMSAGFGLVSSRPWLVLERTWGWFRPESCSSRLVLDSFGRVSTTIGLFRPIGGLFRPSLARLFCRVSSAGRCVRAGAVLDVQGPVPARPASTPKRPCRSELTGDLRRFRASPPPRGRPHADYPELAPPPRFLCMISLMMVMTKSMLRGKRQRRAAPFFWQTLHVGRIRSFWQRKFLITPWLVVASISSCDWARVRVGGQLRGSAYIYIYIWFNRWSGNGPERIPKGGQVRPWNRPHRASLCANIGPRAL